MIIGHAINSRPDLFSSSCVAMHQPVLDPIGDTQYFASGQPVEAPGFADRMLRMLTSELGPITPDLPWNGTKEVYGYIKSYAPYDNIQAQAYPAILLTSRRSTSLDTDATQRHYNYWAGLKFAAKVREARTNGQLVLVRTFNSTTDSSSLAELLAMQQAFMLNFLGLADAPAGTGTGRRLTAASSKHHSGPGGGAASKHAAAGKRMAAAAQAADGNSTPKHKKGDKASAGARKLLLGTRELQSLTIAAQEHLPRSTAAQGLGHAWPVTITASRASGVRRAAGLMLGSGQSTEVLPQRLAARYSSQVPAVARIP